MRGFAAATLSLWLISVALVGCTGATDPAPQPVVATTVASTPSVAADSDALVSLSPNAAYEIPVSPGETVADGSLVLSNTGRFPLRITAIEPAFDAGGGEGFRIVGVKVVELERGFEQAVGIRRSFPPKGSVDAVGSVLEPSTQLRAYEVILGFRVTAGTHRLSAVRVSFELDNKSYATDFPLRTTLCKAANATATSC